MDAEDARRKQIKRRRITCTQLLLLLEEIIQSHQMNMLLLLTLVVSLIGLPRRKRHIRQLRGRYVLVDRIPAQVKHMDRLVRVSDRYCFDNMRMNRNAFGRLCRILRQYSGLTDSKYIKVEEQVAMFLCILSHHKKTRIIGFEFTRSSHTVSRYMHNVLGGVLKLHETLFVQPEPVPDNCTDHRWKWFKGAVGALDGTYINVRAPIEDQPRFRSRKGQISTNTLAACDRFLRFTYVLPGWEGSAGDSRVLRDAVSRPHGLRVPIGTYYLCDNAYANSEGFLTPYKGVRYHLKEWGPAAHMPQNPEELFNMRHTKARNIIERAFAILKMRWGILRSPSFYPLQVQIRLITCCFILHNFIRREMDDDPIENQLDTELGEVAEGEELGENLGYVDSIEPTDAWTNKRRDLALHMWNNRDGH